jgi:hypothetical protein
MKGRKSVKIEVGTKVCWKKAPTCTGVVTWMSRHNLELHVQWDTGPSQYTFPSQLIVRA